MIWLCYAQPNWCTGMGQVFTFASGIIVDYCASQNLNWIVCCEPSASGFESFLEIMDQPLCEPQSLILIFLPFVHLRVFDSRSVEINYF